MNWNSQIRKCGVKLSSQVSKFCLLDDMTDAINLYLGSRNSYRAVISPVAKQFVITLVWLGAQRNANEQSKMCVHL